MVPLPDVTTGLCADGSQPQSQGQTPENVSGAPGGVTTEEQLVCSDGTAPDVTTGLCADGSQPASQTELPANGSVASVKSNNAGYARGMRNMVPREEPIQPVEQASVIHTDDKLTNLHLVSGNRG